MAGEKFNVKRNKLVETVITVVLGIFFILALWIEDKIFTVVEFVRNARNSK